MLQLKDISKEYHTGSLTQRALDHVSVAFRDNEFVAILGPSGSGKTTMLNIIGGLDRYDSGDLIIGGISTKKYKDRDWDSYRNHTVGFVFQSYNLIMHQTVLSNVELALTISGISGSERKKRAEDALRKVGLGEQMHKLPNQMSGGQMQRVAIARALVNDPDIVLADEPTGALDSETSVQVMNLLKEVAKDRLVVMVTHNPELAHQYATRIVMIKDGHVIDDTDPYNPTPAEEPVHKNMGKSSMSFFTALSLSFNNLRTKKARTILVAFAGSIGIIGIALILSLSNGVNRYIHNIESQTLSEYPLQIEKSGFSLSSFMGGGSSGSGSANSSASNNDDETMTGQRRFGARSSSKGDKKTDNIQVMNMVSRLFSQVSTNDLGSLKKYLDTGNSGIKKYTSSVEYQYNVTPRIYRIDSKNEALQLNPSNLFDSMNSRKSNMTSFSGSMSTMMGSAMNSDYFYALPSSPDLYKSQYEVVAGSWPKSSHDLTLVLSDNGEVSDVMLYGLGMNDRSTLNTMLKQYENGESVKVKDSDKTYSTKDFLGLKMKLVLPSDLYQYDSSLKLWQDKSDDAAFLKKAVEKGTDLTITGIVRPKEGTQISSLQMGIAYPSSLTQELMKKSAQTQIVKEQLANPKKNVFTGNTFSKDNSSNSSNIDLSQLFSVDQDALKKAFSINTDGNGNLDISKLMGQNGSSADLSKLLGQSGSSADLSKLLGQNGSSADLSKLLGQSGASASGASSSADISALTKSMQSALSDPTSLSKLLNSASASADTKKNNGTQKGSANSSAPSASTLTSALSSADIQSALSKVKITATPETVSELFQKLSSGFQAYAEKDPSSDYAKLNEAVKAYLYSGQAQQIVQADLQKLLEKNKDSLVTTDELTQILTESLSAYPDYVNQKGLDPENFTENLKTYLNDENSGAKAQLNQAVEKIKGQFTNIGLSKEDLESFAADLYNGYDDYAKSLQLPQISKIAESFGNYLKTDDAKTLLMSYAGKMVDTSSLQSAVSDVMTKMISSQLSNMGLSADSLKNLTALLQGGGNIDLSKLTQAIGSSADISKLMQAFGGSSDVSQLLAGLSGQTGGDLNKQLQAAQQNMVNQIMQQVESGIQKQLQSSMQSAMKDMSSQMQKMFQIDPSAFSKAVSMKMSANDLEQLFSSLMNSRQSSYDQNLTTLGYADPDEPTEIDIYPKDFNDKEQVTKILDNYNGRMKKTNQDSKVISYTDMVATMMSSVTTIINTISYVLIAFVAISLIVSSIMIGVITYISVLERRKEIGILRAIGASKHNVSQVFNAETFITGLLAGLIGIGITIVLIFPINHLIHTVAGQPDINAVLPVTGAVALIVLSILLTLLAGLIPSSKAAKSDPVTALRTE